MIDSKMKLSISKQCKLLFVSRNCFYYSPKGELKENQIIMDLLKIQYLATPFYGYRKMSVWLEGKGFKVGNTSEFLGLTSPEEAIIELRLALSKALKTRREQMNLTQNAFAKKLHSSQSRVAKMEAGDQSVTFDLLIKSLISAGIDRKSLGEIVSSV